MFSYGPIRIMASFNYLAVAFAAIVDYVIWKQNFSWLVWAGTILVILGAITTAFIGNAKIK